MAPEGLPFIQIFKGNSTNEKKTFSFAGSFTGAVRQNVMERKHVEIVANCNNRKQNDDQSVII